MVGVIVLLAAGLFAFFLMGLGMAYSSDGCAQFPGCDDAVFDAFVAGVCVLVGSFVVAMAVAIWRRRSRLMYWALLGYLLAFVLFSWGYNRALESRWPG